MGKVEKTAIDTRAVPMPSTVLNSIHVKMKTGPEGRSTTNLNIVIIVYIVGAGSFSSLQSSPIIIAQVFHLEKSFVIWYSTIVGGERSHT